MEVELVGVTRNTARSQQGWAPDGSSIGEIPDWNPSKVLIHEGNTIGFRTEGTPHTDARDLLFEIRGAKLPPSFEIVGMIESHTWSPSSTQDPLRDTSESASNNSV